MLRLRKILLLDYVYYIILVISIISVLLRLNIPKNTHYSIHSKSAIGVVESIKFKDSKYTITIKNSERLIGSMYIKNDKDIPNIKLGDKVRITGIFQKPSINTNNYLFNYRDYCSRNNIFYLVEMEDIILIKSNSNFYYYLKDKCYRHLTNPYLKTFILGDKSMINSLVKRSYQENGISHLFAISGMHITLIVSLLNKLFKKIGVSEINIFKFIMIILLIYLALIGFTPSIVRAILFYLLFSINSIYYFYVKPSNIFILTLVISLFINPYYIYDVGFLYSYIISFTLLLKTKELGSNNYFISLFKVSIYAFLVSMPITMYSFYQVNVLGIIYNLLFVPLVSLIVFPLSLIVSIIGPLEGIYSFIIKVLENLSLFLVNINVGKIIFKRIPFVFYILYMFIIMLYVFSKRKIFLIIYILLLFIHCLLPYFDNSSYLKMIDVGQGDSLFLRVNKKNILIDTGGVEENISSNQGSIFYNTLQPVLRSSGVKEIDYLILSHGDGDHMSEAIYLINYFKVKKVIFNCGEYDKLEQTLIKSLKRKRIKYYQCISFFKIIGGKFYFLNTGDYNDENENSSVIYAEIKGNSFLFTGDAGKVREKDIIAKYDLSSIDVLKVGHHGSKTSSSKEFIDKIKPKYSIISVGKNNRYGHPNKEVLNNLEKSKIFRTDLDGSIMFKIKNNKLKIETCSP